MIGVLALLFEFSGHGAQEQQKVLCSLLRRMQKIEVPLIP